MSVSYFQNSGKAERTEVVFKKSKLRLQNPALSSTQAITKDNSNLIGPDGSRDLNTGFSLVETGSRDLNTGLSLVVTKDNSDLIAAKSRVKNVLRKSAALKSEIINKLEQNDMSTL